MTYTLYAEVIPDKSVAKPLDYGLPADFVDKVKPGQRVAITIRGKSCKGTVLSTKTKSLFENIKPIDDLISEGGVLTDDLFALAEWMSEYYAAPIAKTISAIIPSSIRKDLQEKKQLFIQRNLSKPKLIEYVTEIRSKNPKQAEVLDIILARPEGILLTELMEQKGITKGPIETLLKNKILKKKKVHIDRSILEEHDFFQTKPKQLSEEQANTLNALEKGLIEGEFSTHLIHGITGSGKTEIYMQAIEKALALKKGVIMLVPEIALTAQTIERLKGRFKERIAILHHRLSNGERFDAWHAIRKGEISIVVGARSAIFSPVPNLGLIIIDEEQENSYKQLDEAPCYHARDVAVMRGKLTKSVVVLGSATPCLETYYNATSGKYKLHSLTKRPAGAVKPTTQIVNMKLENEKVKGFALLSDLLLKKIETRIANGEQSILFLNRRGYYTCQVCSSCLKTQTCSHCDISLTYHKHENILSCHICGFTKQSESPKCMHCGSLETLKYRGPGTEQLERTLHAIFPNIRTLRMDRDTTAHKGSHDDIFRQFRAGKADVLIGTQMIAKGLHFSNVTLVGILGVDSSLNIPDFRANENVFSLVTQVAGRSGRGDLPGEVIIQTSLPEHPVIELASKEEYEKFFQAELEERKLFDYPPFSRLVKIVFSGKDPEKARAFAEKYRLTLQTRLPSSYEVLPVTPCGYAKIKDNHRFQFITKGKDILPLSRTLKNLPIKPLSSVKTLIDVNPISTW